MYGSIQAHLLRELETIRTSGLLKGERLLASAQGARVVLADGRQVLNMCANNYLGLASHPQVIEAACEAARQWGYGLASVRFICGTQSLHKKLEEAVSTYLGTEDTLLYSSCFDANTGLFEVLLDEQDAVISDSLNHASIIDGIRLCRARRLRYANGDMHDLETRLVEARENRFRLIATDGVFSMDGTVAKLQKICDLAEQHDALVMVDDSHAVGFWGATGRGTHEYCQVMGRVDILTGTFGKALGGAGGGYTSGRREIIALLRQRSRPYLFSNTLPPMVAAGSLKALEILSADDGLRQRLATNTGYFRAAMRTAGFDIPPGEHPIVPIMLGDAALAHNMAEALLEQGVYVVGFSYPVVPLGKARIRVQISVAHTLEDLDFAVDRFAKVRQALIG